ncbi:hypothetical protein MOQ_006233 [Trypanosoma cruzi marinkellei]|uniref:Uncharacterized protein n=1 Tax=Trypanosoma cruzi marinkellei TaxID=85056 RepID=K2N5P8_TRYCR|nr:hypothetical protein MOQ_006233 [Trypanosoma cruzi marinkellei]
MLALTPQQVAEEMKVISLLRQELSNTHVNYDEKPLAELPFEPAHRTVDAKTLRTLKCTSYPFIVCEEAPTSYQAPIPYRLERVIERLREELRSLEENLKNAEALQRESTGRQRSTSPSHGGYGRDGSRRYPKEQGKQTRKEDAVQLFLEVVGRDAGFANLSKEVSMVRWYTRWVSSHSFICLEEALEQVEYVISEGGLTTEADLVEAMQQFSFVEAVSTLENDRRQVVEAERHRMHSHSRTFREHVSPLSITAATSSFLTPEEKYWYQECYNQTEHVMTMLNHVLYVQFASKGRDSSLVSSGGFCPITLEAGSNFFSMKETTSVEEESQILSDAAMRALRQERDVITNLLRKIQDRQENGVMLNLTREQYRKSLLAAMVVYKCLVDDMVMLRSQKSLAAEFLAQYDNWIFHRCGTNDQAVIRRLGIATCEGSPPKLLMGHTTPRGNSNSPSHEREISVPLSCYSPMGQLPRHVEEVCESFMSLLKLSRRPFGTDNSTGVRENVYRRWMCLSLRYTCMQIVRGRWPGDLLFDGMDEIASNLIRLVSDYNSNPGAVQPHLTELTAVLRCFLGLVAEGAARRQAQREFPGINNGTASSLALASANASSGVTSVAMRTFDVSVTFSLDRDIASMERAANIIDEDEDVWGAIFDALWFQADPTGRAHGGFLSCKDFGMDVEKPFVFLRLGSITLPDRLPKTAEGRRFPKVYMSLHYVIHTADMSPARSLTEVAEGDATVMASTSVVTRYGYMRRMLYIFSILERRKLIQDYACRVEEVELVPIENAVFLSRKRDKKITNTRLIYSAHPPPGNGGDASTGEKYTTVVGLIPPAAVQLMRYNAIPTGTEYPVSRGTRPTLTTLNLLLGTMLKKIALCRSPLLDKMYKMGDTLCEQGVGVAEEKDNDNGSQGKPLVLPILRAFDEYISSPGFEKSVKEADDEMRQQSTQHVNFYHRPY